MLVIAEKVNSKVLKDKVCQHSTTVDSSKYCIPHVLSLKVDCFKLSWKSKTMTLHLEFIEINLHT